MNKKLIVFLIIVLVAITSAGWYFFWRELKPQEVMQRMKMAMSEVKSFHYESALSTNLDLEEIIKEATKKDLSALFLPTEKVFTANLLATGDLLLNDNGLPEAHQAIIEFYTTPTSFIQISTELRNIDEVAYFKLNNLTTFLPFDSSALLNKWYLSDSLQKLNLLKNKKETMTGESESNQWKQTLAQIQSLNYKADFFEVIEVLPEEKINQKTTYHYKIKTNLPAVKAYAEEMFNLLKLEKTSQGQDFLNQLAANLENLKGEFWIGKKDFLLYRIKIELPVKYALENTGESVQMTFSLVLNYSRFNEPVEVVAPTNTLNVQDFIKTLLGGLLGNMFNDLPTSGDRKAGALPEFSESEAGSALESEMDWGALGNSDRDGDGLIDIQESFWLSNPENPDTDGDGYLDGAEVKNGYSPTGSGRLFQ